MAKQSRNVLTKVSTGVTLKDTVANQVSTVFELKVPAGTSLVIPKNFQPIFEFLDSGGAELPETTEIYLGILTPDEPRIVRHITSKYMYKAWKDLSMTQQQSDEFFRAVTLVLGVPYLPLTAEEKFVIQLYSDTVCDAGTDEAHLSVSIPYVERSIEGISGELAERMQFMGV